MTMNRDGRVLIPKQVRQELGLDPGSTLVLSVEDGRVILESRDQLMARIRRDVAAAWQGAPTRSVAAELLADRRAEADAEDAR
ncbi:hypothetical protein Ae406Ps2_0782c [Pseudonocardia sp. Ae406_Ps2]|nr:hypothetical protein Ae406Ps2_0782c [Pseudonocardia sp. Ae406_Ps2]OLM07428.1 hypothetical protein Ae331Ps2_5138 [Pseudonocardia sp. Ae331_Ps2]OLM14616.1 hypothetical protein Ae505Ps2_4746 [Pseudonocardia sp. Ae505_Ps2]OLM22359.1 hypothetical protein Ae706Ps2_0791c [Pseudonocardia sp. Ae706_Ps2]